MSLHCHSILCIGGHISALGYDSVLLGKSLSCAFVTVYMSSLAGLQFCMLFYDLIVGGLSLCSRLWMSTAGVGFELQHRSRCFVAPILPIGQVFALQAEGVIEAFSV